MPTATEDSENEMFSLNKNALLKLYDEKPKKRKKGEANDEDTDYGSPITAITSLLGEDLVLGLFELFLEERNDGFRTRPDYDCRTDGSKGPQLDAWVLTKKDRCYQMEIKNWGASAKGGRGIKAGDEADWLKSAHHNYNRYLRAHDNLMKIWKVVAPMMRWKNDATGSPEPLLGFWSPVAPESVVSPTDIETFFTAETKDFEEEIRAAGMWPPIAKTVHIFSASNYLRTNKKDIFRIRMPRVTRRLAKLRGLGITFT
jgi:hypothetical protein